MNIALVCHSSVCTTKNPANICRNIQNGLHSSKIWKESSQRTHLISPEPFYLEPEQIDQLRQLGETILAFYRAANRLYTYKGNDWVKEYLDAGKGDEVVRHSRMNYHKQEIPRVLRPDIMLTDDGFYITELDSVPGGIGHLSFMCSAYEAEGFRLAGSFDGMLSGFEEAIREVARCDDPTLAIVVSDESEDYRAEMTYLADMLRARDLRAYTVHPSELEWADDRVCIDTPDAKQPVDVVYRFYELFDLQNIPNIEILNTAAQRRILPITPPHKHFLEEKMLLALLHLEALQGFWVEHMGEKEYSEMRQVSAPTWILDNREIPPHAQISGFTWQGKPIRDWRDISSGTQKMRELVIKPSGFSELAWGSRGVKIGSDMSAEAWAGCVDEALDSFQDSPHVLQTFKLPKRVAAVYADADGEIKRMQGRARLCPYYFVHSDRANMGGVMATICPKDKKIIHGMRDSIIVPCASK